MMVKTLKQVA